MVKESSRDGNLKKKRKTATNSDNDVDIDIYKKAIEFEEKEALSRSNDEDAKLYFDTCKEIRQLLSEIGELKMKGPDAKSKIAIKTSEICLKIVVLKKLNRMEKVRLVLPKEQLNAEKQKVDSINLQYQNLLYEANHLISEYRKCFQFKSKDENIDLVPISEFLAEAPENLTSKFKDIDENDEVLKHELRLARLEWELKQRIELANTCKKLEAEKKKLEEEITERKLKLEKLGPLLANVMEATKPVQEHLGLHIDKLQAEHKLASLLPDPLYIFYANADAYRQVNDKSMNVAIIGDQEEAIQAKEMETISSVVDELEDEISEPEFETQEVEEVVETKKRRHRKSMQIDPMEERRKKLLQTHPLAVEITISIRNGLSIKIKVNYFIKLEIVTVTADVEIPSSITGNVAKEVLSNESILNELLPGDFGIESPTPCTQYQLQKVGLGSFRNLITDLGYAYSWAQKVCGLDFLTNKNTKNHVSDHLSQINVELILKTIKTRLRCRYELAKQLDDLEKNIIPPLPKTIELPRTTISTLTKWTSSNYQQFCQSVQTAALVESEVVLPNDMFYCAVITRGAANLKTFIVVKNDYPSTPPLFSLCLEYNGLIHHSSNNDDIRDMERSVNMDWNNISSNSSCLLSAQIVTLCIGLDIYLETEDSQTFQQNIMYIKPTSGRNRRKPFKFRNVGVGVFTQ